MAKLSSSVDLSDIEEFLTSDEMGTFMSHTTHKHYYKSMPKNTGNFADNIDFETPWEYTHKPSYSHWVYTLNQNYRTNYNPYAMSNYIEGFAPVAVPLIEQELINFINTRG